MYSKTLTSRRASIGSEHLAQVFDVSPVPMMVLDRALCFVACNDAHVAMVGRSREEMLGKYVFEVFPETADRIEALLTMFRRTLAGETTSLEATPFALIKDGVRHENWWSVSHSPLRNDEGEVIGLVQFSENVTESMRLRRLNEAIMGELHHRIGNLFTVILALARQVARTATDVPEFMERFESKIENLVQGQRSLDTKVGSAADLRTIFRHQLGVYLKFAADRISFDGPEVLLSPGQTKALSMIAHELATNSLKYGAIKSETGRLTVNWTCESSGKIRLTWSETGLGALPETTTGYGQRLLTDILPKQLNAHATRRLDENGLVYEIVFRPEGVSVD